MDASGEPEMTGNELEGVEGVGDVEPDTTNDPD